MKIIKRLLIVFFLPLIVVWGLAYMVGYWVVTGELYESPQHFEPAKPRTGTYNSGSTLLTTQRL